MSDVHASPLTERERVTMLLTAAEGLTDRREPRVTHLLTLTTDWCAARASPIAPLLRAAAQLRFLSETAARDTAPDFNLFRLLDRSYREITHDRILADILDPHGSHGQGTLFLRLFMDTLAECADDDPQPRVREVAPALKELS